jgi:plasmid stability protein
MSKMLQIRSVPEQVQLKLKARAAAEGQTLSDHLRRIVESAAERPTVAELCARPQDRRAEDPRPTPTEVIRSERNAIWRTFR